jgi:hypothetical protein
MSTGWSRVPGQACVQRARCDGGYVVRVRGVVGCVCMAGRKASQGSSRRVSGEPDRQAPPAWKRYAKKDKTLGRQAEATLEMIWSKTEWLTDDHIQGMWEEHRVGKEAVVAWFANKRRESRRRKQHVVDVDVEGEGDAVEEGVAGSEGARADGGDELLH